MHTLALAGAELTLLPSGSALLPQARTLLVADAHFGKAWSFRRLGVPVPEATTAQTLARLSADLAATAAERLVFLGDFLHASRSRAARLFEQLAQWRQQHAQLALTLVRGNHDAHAGDPPVELGVEVVNEPLHNGPFALCHDPRPVPGRYVLGGHWHPCMSLGRGIDRLRLPCFWFGDDSGDHPREAVGVLPAFGSFTGMHRIEPRARDRVFVIAGDSVRAVPRMVRVHS